MVTDHSSKANWLTQHHVKNCCLTDINAGVGDCLIDCRNNEFLEIRTQSFFEQDC